MEEQIILETKESKHKLNKKSLALFFRILSIVVAVLGIVLGVLFGFDEVERFSYYSQKIVTQTVFELWRALIFWFTGLCSSLCLFAVSTVFKALSKKK